MIGDAIAWRWCPFEGLSPAELYELMALRQRVFVVEQGCPYVDADGLDPIAWHLLGRLGGSGEGEGRRLVASARIFDRRPGFGEFASIGRVAVDRSARGLGLGRALLAEAIARCNERAPGRAIRIQAQLYLQTFYEAHGFRRSSAPYLYDGIVHLDMVRPA